MAKRIGKYKLGKPLGVGTVGTVYRARDVDTQQEVALKILLPEVSNDANIAGRFSDLDQVGVTNPCPAENTSDRLGRPRHKALDL